MTANELANLLKVDSWYKLVTREEITTMLRQQQAEIEALKKQCALLQEGYNAQAILLGVETGLIPDTHPVKELTDEEITAIAKEIFNNYKNFHHYQIDFARAILLKTQEK